MRVARGILEGVQPVVRGYFRSAGLAKYGSLHPPRSIKVIQSIDIYLMSSQDSLERQARFEEGC